VNGEQLEVHLTSIEWFSESDWDDFMNELLEISYPTPDSQNG